MTNSDTSKQSHDQDSPRSPQNTTNRWGDKPSKGHIPGYPKPEDGGPRAEPPTPGKSEKPGKGDKNSDGELKPPKVGRPDGLAPNLKAAPEDVHLGVRAWLATAGLQILYAVMQFLANLSDDRELRSSVTQALDDGPGIPEDLQDTVSVDTLVLGTNVLTSMWTVVAALICIWLAFRAGRGAVYSRMFLNVGSIYLMLTALLLVFSSAPGTMDVAYVLALGILTILSGVTAALGMWFMSRKGNEEWFGIPSAEEFQKYVDKVEEQRAKKAEEKKKKEKDEAKQDKK